MNPFVGPWKEQSKSSIYCSQITSSITKFRIRSLVVRIEAMGRTDEIDIGTWNLVPPSRGRNKASSCVVLGLSRSQTKKHVRLQYLQHQSHTRTLIRRICDTSMKQRNNL